MCVRGWFRGDNRVMEMSAANNCTIQKEALKTSSGQASFMGMGALGRDRVVPG